MKSVLLAATLGLASVAAHADLVYESTGTTTSTGAAPASLVSFDKYLSQYPASLPTSGFFLDELATTGIGNISYTYIGAEAGYHNTFSLTSTVFTTPGIYGSFATCTVACSTSPITTGGGLLPFSFGNGALPPLSVLNTVASNTASEPDFYVAIVNPDLAYLYFNDAGAADDRDYNDMIIKVTFAPVPEPSTYALLFAGLGMLGLMARRRSR